MALVVNEEKSVLILIFVFFLQVLSGQGEVVSRSLYVRQGEAFNITCSPPSFDYLGSRILSWYKDGDSIGHCRLYKIWLKPKSSCRVFNNTYRIGYNSSTQSSTVYIPNALPARDTGTWMCVLTNGRYVLNTSVTVLHPTGGKERPTSTSSTSTSIHMKKNGWRRGMEELMKEIMELKEEMNEVKIKEEELVNEKDRLMVAFVVTFFVLGVFILVVISLGVYIYRLKRKACIDTTYSGLDLDQRRNQESCYTSLQSDITNSAPAAPPAGNTNEVGDFRPNRENSYVNNPRRGR